MYVCVCVWISTERERSYKPLSLCVTISPVKEKYEETLFNKHLLHPLNEKLFVEA